MDIRTLVRRSLRSMAAAGSMFALAAVCEAQCVISTDRSGSLTGQSPSWAIDLIYDSLNQRSLAIHQSAPGDRAVVSAYNGSSWTPIAATGQIPPGPRYSGAWVYDSARNVGLLFSGALNCTNCVATNTLFAFSGSNWQQLTWTGVTPPARYGGFGAFDPRRGRAIFLLGADPGVPGWTTWEWTGSSWEKGPSFGPVGIDAFVFDTVRNVGFVEGTSDTNYPLEEVWEYTPGATAAAGSWHRVPIAGSPYEARISTRLAFDPYRDRILRCFGRSPGSVTSYVPSIDTWDPVASTWQHLNYNDYLPTAARRGGAGVAYDLARDRLVIYGGGRVDPPQNSFTALQDTWEQTRGAPGFINRPSAAVVDGGQTAIFAATTIGEGLSLQWLFNGAPIAGANGPILAVPRASQSLAGSYVLRLSNNCALIDSPPATLTVRPPANNSATTPSVLYASSISGTTLGATPDGVTTCGTSNSSPDIWYRYTVPYSGSLAIDTCGSDFDTVLSLHGPTAATTITCNDDVPAAGGSCGLRDSSLSLAVTQGQQFLVRVSGFQGAAGNFVLNTRLTPFNNACAAATPVFAGTYVGTTTGATTDGAASCGTSNASPDIWYRFRSDCSGTLSLNTLGSTLDTVLSVRRSACNGVELACNDDAQFDVRYSAVTVSVDPGVDYFIRVSGFNGASGNVTLNVAPPPIAGDACAAAAPIGLGQTAFATRCATTSTLSLPPWCEGAPGAVPFYDVWYSYTVAAPGTLEIRLCNTSYNCALAVYGSACPASAYDAIVCAAREDSCGASPLAAIDTLPGQQYLIRVGGYYGLNAALAGAGTIELTLVPFETGACCLNAGGCSLTSAYECAGIYQGEGSACGVSCPSLNGSCCTGTHCLVLDPAACISAGGAFGGTGTACLQSPANPTTCCRANFNGANGLNVQDLFDFLNAWFGGDARADFNGLDSLNVQDIFDYLNAWFAGC